MSILNLKENDDLKFWGMERTSKTKTIVLGDTPKEYDVYKIPVDILAYNLSNGRMFMEVKKFESEQEQTLAELKETDVELYNDEVESIIWKTKEDRNEYTKDDIEEIGQLEPGVVLDDGTVIDGNRRFTCIRKLHREHPEDERFKYFLGALVQVDGVKVTRALLKKYELKVQFGQDEKVGYNTINMNMSLYELIEKNPGNDFDYSTVAELVGKSESKIIQICNTCRLVDEFLQYVNRNEEYSIAEKMKVYSPLEPLEAYIKKSEKNLSPLEMEERKKLYFDYLLALDIDTPTQNLRDRLIKKVYADPNETKNLIEKHNEIIGSKIQSIIDSNLDIDEFCDSFDELKDSTEGQEDRQLYYETVDRLTNVSQLDVQVRECKRALSALQNVHVKPLVEADTEFANQKLAEIKEQLGFIITRINNIELEMNK